MFDVSGLLADASLEISSLVYSSIETYSKNCVNCYYS